MANKEISALDADAGVTGVEVFPVDDAGSGKKISVQQVSDFVFTEISGETTAVGPVDSGDSFMILENDTDLKPATYELVYAALKSSLYGETALGAAVTADDAFLLRDGGVAGTDKTVTAANIASYMLTTLEAAILDITDLAANATPADSDLVMVASGATPKKTTWLQLKTLVMAGFQAYLIALSASAGGADSDVIYVSKLGTEYKMTLSQLKTYINASITGSGSAGKLAVWTGATSLDDSISIVNETTGFTSGTDLAVPTTACVRNEMDNIVTDQAALAAIADADTILVDDADSGVPTKSTFTKVWTWLWAKISGATNKAVIADADSIGIVDSAASNVVKNSTFTNIWAWLTSKLTSSSVTIGNIQTGGYLGLGGVNPAEITGNVNNWDPDGGGGDEHSVIFADVDALGPHNVTGMLASSVEEMRIIVNIGGSALTISNEDGSSDAANRFLTTTGASLTLGQNGICLAMYDQTNSRWHIALL